jgi:hypothetical protein
MSIRSARSLWISVVLLSSLGCTDPADSGSSLPVGNLSAALNVSAAHDVTSVRFDILPGAGSCHDPALTSRTVVIEDEPLPASTAGTGAGMHQFVDGLFVLPPGLYLVCATPLAASDPSADCQRAQATVAVVAWQTSETLLVSQCKGKPNGGLDLVVALNDPPHISGLEISPSKFITTCQQAALAVTAADPDGDAITYSWSVLAGPSGSSLRSSGATAAFSGPAGDYVVSVWAMDSHGASTALRFPVHVSTATCAVSPEVHAIFNLRCASCHIAASQGGLSLATAEAAFTNLVGAHAAASGCMDRVRVIPGNAGSSYLVAKLRNLTPICGLPMPRNRPPLPEEEIAAIEAWIDGLPH